jgi:hypothetical protein
MRDKYGIKKEKGRGFYLPRPMTFRTTMPQTVHVVTPSWTLQQIKFGYLFVGFIISTALYGVTLSQVRISS